MNTAENPNAESERNLADAIASGSTVVSASATMSATAMVGGAKSDLSLRIEAAMVEATLKASADGVTDPEDIKALKLAARDAVLGY